MKKTNIFLIITILLSVTCGCKKTPQLQIVSGTTQGTYYQISYYAEHPRIEQEEIEEELQQFLLIASLWEPNSIISKVNRNEPVELNEDFVAIFSTAQEISRETGGAFDITVGDLVNLWGFGFKSGQEPTATSIDSLLKFVGYQKVSVIDHRVIKEHPETSIDFNAIAKGYSADMISNLLRRKGINDFIVDIGGEIVAAGKKPDGSAWNIGIEKPANDRDASRQLQIVISLSNKSVATSGTYRKYREIDSIRYSHTVDPKTGRPVSHSLLSVSVIADRCVVADALATAFMVMGMEKAISFLENHPEYEAFFIYSGKDGAFQTTSTNGFKDYIL